MRVTMYTFRYDVLSLEILIYERRSSGWERKYTQSLSSAVQQTVFKDLELEQFVACNRYYSCGT